MRNLSTIVLSVALIVGIGGPCAVIVLVWDRAPFWRKYPTPRRQIDDMQDHLKMWRLRHRHPEAFMDYQPPKEDA